MSKKHNKMPDPLEWVLHRGLWWDGTRWTRGLPGDDDPETPATVAVPAVPILVGKPEAVFAQYVEHSCRRWQLYPGDQVLFDMLVKGHSKGGPEC